MYMYYTVPSLRRCLIFHSKYRFISLHKLSLLFCLSILSRVYRIRMFSCSILKRRLNGVIRLYKTLACIIRTYFCQSSSDPTTI